MKKTIQQTATMVIYLLITAFTTHAQSWQWGKRGGGQFDGSTANLHELIIDMASDKNGNSYTIGLLSSSGTPNVDGTAVVGYGEKDIIVSSFRCDGTYRWSKIIGGAGNEIPGSINVDTIGNVYVSGTVIPKSNISQQVHFSNDTAQGTTSTKTLFLIQYDTAGNFKWLRQPSPDTASFARSYRYSKNYDLMVTGDGTIYWFVGLNKGLLSGGNGRVAPNDSGYILKYDASGTLSDMITMPMEIKNFYGGIHMSRSISGKFIMAGFQDFANGSALSVGGQSMLKGMFIAAFTSTGQFLWKKENTVATSASRIFSRPAIDAQENIYISGAAGLNDLWNGHTFTNPLFAVSPSVPFINKMDISGNSLWIKTASAKANNLYNNVVLKNGNEIWFSGTTNSFWWDANLKMQSQPNEGYHIFATRLNSQGTVLSLDSIKGNFGSQNYTYASCADRNGNLYIGGEFDGTLIVGSQSLNKYGASDFFIAKLGNNLCGCTIPTSSFNKTITARTISLTYNGTTTSVDSVVWDYGNGVKSTRTGAAISTAFNYTYPANGTYNICVTAYSACGSNPNCQSVMVTNVGVSNVASSNLKVYPNPANDFVVIEGGVDGTYISVTNLLGQQLLHATINSNKQSLSLSGLSVGTYLIVLTSNDGTRETVRVVKQ